MKHMMKQLMTKLTPTGLMFVCLVFAHSIAAQQQTEHSQETRELLDELALKIQVTVATIQENEALAGNEKTSSYSIDIPAVNKLELGLELDVSDPSNGFRVLTVDENSLADQLGIETGDLVVTVNHFEVNVTNTEVILSELQSLQAGDTLALMINRENRLKQFTITIEENPLPPATIYVGKDELENTATSVVAEPFQRDIAGLPTVGSAQADWKNFSGGNRLAGMYVRAINDRRMVIFYSCGSVSGPECRMDMQLTLPCTFEQGKFTMLIQYGERSTTAILECKGKGGSMKFPALNGNWSYGGRWAKTDVRPPNAPRFQPNAKVRHFYSWTITLPNQGDGAVPKFTDKKLEFIFDVNGSQKKYFFETNGWEKKMEEFHQKWAMANKHEE